MRDRGIWAVEFGVVDVGADLVETIAGAAEHIEVQIELGARGDDERAFCLQPSDLLSMDFAATPGNQ